MKYVGKIKPLTDSDYYYLNYDEKKDEIQISSDDPYQRDRRTWGLVRFVGTSFEFKHFHDGERRGKWMKPLYYLSESGDTPEYIGVNCMLFPLKKILDMQKKVQVIRESTN